MGYWVWGMGGGDGGPAGSLVRAAAAAAAPPSSSSPSPLVGRPCQVVAGTLRSSSRSGVFRTQPFTVVEAWSPAGPARHGDLVWRVVLLGIFVAQLTVAVTVPTLAVVAQVILVFVRCGSSEGGALRTRQPRIFLLLTGAWRDHLIKIGGGCSFYSRFPFFYNSRL